MKKRLLKTTYVERSIVDVFAFFSNAENLAALTPPWVRFEILSLLPVPMHEGTTIDYRIRLHGIPVRWRSEITAWEPPFRFVDEQRRGPYRSWIHQHRFIEREGGTEILDDVTYSVWGGALVERLFVDRNLARIFDYRQQRIHELLGPSTRRHPAASPARPATEPPAARAPTEGFPDRATEARR